MTEFSPSPILHRQFGQPFNINCNQQRDTKQHVKRSRQIDDLEERLLKEEEGDFADIIEQSTHIDFNPEKRNRYNSYTNTAVLAEDKHIEYVQPEKRTRHNSIFQPSFSSQSGFAFNDSSTTILRLETELRSERQEVQVKVEQLHMAALENKSITDQMKTIDLRSMKLVEENKILKRAVQIQEGRMKDLNQKNQQLQLFLTQAIQRIAELENASGKSTNQFDGSNSQFSPHRPPDVF